MIFKREDFTYSLPQNLIAQTPHEKRDSSKLLVFDRASESIKHTYFSDVISFLQKGDVLVLNDTKVFPARISVVKGKGGREEILLLKNTEKTTWIAMVHSRFKKGTTFSYADITGRVVERDSATGWVRLVFDCSKKEFENILYKNGKTPLPPYIKSPLQENDARKKYQTVYAKELGSAAAPTAGLHFTSSLLEKITEKGVRICYVTLHVGPGTFQTVWDEMLENNVLHKEEYEISKETADAICAAKKIGHRVISVGTTTTRALESAALEDKKNIKLNVGKNETKLFINPEYKFKIVDSLITNFHLPESSLLMMISAFSTYPQTKEKFSTFRKSSIGNVYHEAIKNKYRFFSFGDAMFII